MKQLISRLLAFAIPGLCTAQSCGNINYMYQARYSDSSIEIENHQHRRYDPLIIFHHIKNHL
jgi:hypothetical protein